jgi:hypothetical protein
MKTKLLLLLCCVLTSSVIAQAIEERYAFLGELFVPQFASAPFPHPVRANGRVYNKQTFSAQEHYSDSSVAIFVPKGFNPGPAVNIVVYFHGWYNNIDSACTQFKLIEQFTESKKNAIFVFPEGPKNSPDSFGGRMEEKDGLKNLVVDVLKFLKQQQKIKTEKVGRIILAGHSGAYQVISFCLLRGGLTKNISDVILFDALYGETEKYSYWIDHFKGRFINIYTNDGGTKLETENLMADLDGWNIPYIQKDEKDITDIDLKKNRTIFIHSELSHNEVIGANNQLQIFLSTSVLDRRKH